MDAIKALTTRKSVSLLIEPAPSEEDVETLLTAALRAPDHAKLRPWRFVVMKKAGLDKLGSIFADAALQRTPDISPEELQKAKTRPHRAPMVIAVIAKIVDHPKVPEIEQILSAGAAAQSIMLAAHAIGYAGIWRSGAPCFDENVCKALGGSVNDQIVGFLYLGTARALAPVKGLETNDYAEYWS